MEDNSKFWREVKALVIFLASGAFVKVHRQFMKPPKELFEDNHWMVMIHHWGHSLIGLSLQVLFILWILRIVYNVLLKPCWLWSVKKVKSWREKGGSQ